MLQNKLNMFCTQKMSPKETFVPKMGIAANIPIQSPKKILVNGLNKQQSIYNSLL
jgi:hypothetical protein